MAKRNQRKQNAIQTLAFFDLNHCDITGEAALSLEEYLQEQDSEKLVSVIILDCTNTTTTATGKAVQTALEYGMKLILLANSGIKHAQNGADNHPYGTVRIIATNQETRDELYDEVKEGIEDSHQMPAMFHKIRKAYKKRGHTPTNEAIFIPVRKTNKIKSLDKMNRYKAVLLERLETLAVPIIKGKIPQGSLLARLESEIMTDLKTIKQRITRTRTKSVLSPTPPSRTQIIEKFNSSEIKERIFDEFNLQFLHLDPQKMKYIFNHCTLDFTKVDTKKSGFLAGVLETALNQYFEELQEQLTN